MQSICEMSKEEFRSRGVPPPGRGSPWQRNAAAPASGFWRQAGTIRPHGHYLLRERHFRALAGSQPDVLTAAEGRCVRVDNQTGNPEKTFHLIGRPAGGDAREERPALPPVERRPAMARLAVVSNRVSVPTSDGAKRAGGLEVALRPALQHNGGIWMGWSGKIGAQDKLKTRSIKDKNVEYIVTDLTRDEYEEYYNGFANRVLWPILHYRLDLAEFARRDLSGYFRVNDHFANELEKVITGDDLVWVHDYHLIPIADALRRRGHSNRIGFFLHVPFPPPEIITSLPNHEQFIPLLMQYDVVGFQTENDAGNFIRYLMSECNQEREMRVFHVTGRHTTISIRGQQTLIGHFPVGIEPRAFQRLARHKARSPMVREMMTSLGGRALVIGVDRLDYSKGLVQRFDAFDHFLANHQEWTGKVVYLQITPKGRSEIPEYADLEETLSSAAGRINGRYGEVSWTPLRYVNRVYSRSALAGLYRAARVGLVTPLRDGMNLVAKEYVAAQDPDDPGVLILSRFAGSAIEFRRALLVNPYDPESVASAIVQALTMPLEERRERHQALLAAVLAYDVDRWQREFLAALRGDNDVTAFPRSGARNRKPEITYAEPAQAHRRIG
jgi:trehalose 6-phosphate synthase